jgi:large subunit ribosomal protein L10
MAKSRIQKEGELTRLMETLKNPQIVIFTAQNGINVTDTQELRDAQKEKGSKVITVKKTLLAKALAEQGFESPLKEVDGLITVTVDHEDAITPTKIITKYKGEFEGLEILGGIYEGKVVDAEVIKELSTLPTFEEAIAQFMCAMKAVGNKLAGTLDALREKMEAEEGEGEILKPVQDDKIEAKKEEVKEEVKEEAPVEEKKEEAPKEEKTEEVTA